MLRAVIYARCSTEEESQLDALKNQVKEAEECIQMNGWLLVDRYVESKSGTTTKGRNEYNRLFEDLLKDKFDIIVIKSQDRLMRNTKDWYIFVDRLTTSRKKLYMYIDRKFYTTDDALITGIKAILAEDYSRELSKKINNAHKNRQKHGGKPILTSNVYGLKKMSDGSYEIIPEEAKVKVRMYELFDAGYGGRTVCNILKNEGVVNRKGVPFNSNNIVRMVKNPLNMGTIVMNKCHYDFEIKKSFRVPESEQFVYPNKVPAIVSEELWLRVNKKIQSRSEVKNKPDDKFYGKNPGKFCLSGKLVCGICGKPFYRHVRPRYSNKMPVYDWKCSTYAEIGRNKGELARPQLRKVQLEHVAGCNNVHLNEEKLFSLLEEICQERYQPNKDKIMNKMVVILNKALKKKDIQSDINNEMIRKEKVEAQLNVLLDKLLDGLISDELYRSKQTSLEQQLVVIKDKIKSYEAEMAKGNELQERIAQIQTLLQEKNLVGKATVDGMLDEIDKILIFPERMELHFSYDKVLGIAADEYSEEVEHEVMTVEYGSYFNPRKKQKEDLEAVVDLMRENPQITAKQIAEKVGISTSGVYQRITKLRKSNRVRFVGKGGIGYWEILE